MGKAAQSPQRIRPSQPGCRCVTEAFTRFTICSSMRIVSRRATTLPTAALSPNHFHQLFFFLAAQLCQPLCEPVDCSPPGSSAQGISQARILEWVAISSSRRSPQSRYRPSSPALVGGFFTTEPPGKLIFSICFIFFPLQNSNSGFSVH